MKTTAQARGFTILELIIVFPILVTFVLIVFTTLSHLSRAGARTSRGSEELTRAMKIAEAFRADARTAEQAEAAPGGRGLALTVGKDSIQYEVDADGRLSRTVNSQQAFAGPRVSDSAFEVVRLDSGTLLVKARVVCLGEAPSTDLAGQPATESGYVVNLNTALRNGGQR